MNINLQMDMWQIQHFVNIIQAQHRLLSQETSRAYHDEMRGKGFRLAGIREKYNNPPSQLYSSPNGPVCVRIVVNGDMSYDDLRTELETLKMQYSKYLEE